MREQPEFVARILIADDEERERNRMAQELGRWGFQVETVLDGVEMLDRLQRDPLPDLVVMDCMMARMDGFQAHDAMRSDPRLRDIPAVVMWARASDNAITLDSALHLLRGDSPFDGVLLKPLDLWTLYNVIINVLGRCHFRRQRPGAQSPPLVLIADDEPMIRRYIAVNLNAAGYQAVEVEDGDVLLREATIGTAKPGVIICDTMMPRMDGFQVRERLLADPDLRDIPFILLVARMADEKVFAEWMSQVDYDAFVFKPFKPETLVTVLTNVLRRRTGE